jgi:hypothetical protein
MAPFILFSFLHGKPFGIPLVRTQLNIGLLERSFNKSAAGLSQLVRFYLSVFTCVPYNW